VKTRIMLCLRAAFVSCWWGQTLSMALMAMLFLRACVSHGPVVTNPDEICNGEHLPETVGTHQIKPAGHLTVTSRQGFERLAINPKVDPYRARAVPGFCGGAKTWVYLCVSESGSVSYVTIVRPSLPVVDKQLPVVLRRWLFHPMIVEGTARPFCFSFTYTVR
jgi:hypothetical protein